MGTVGEQFDIGRRAFGAGDGETREPAFRRAIEGADRCADRREVAAAEDIVVEIAAFDPQPALDAPHAAVPTLDGEDPGIAGQRRRDEGLLALGREIRAGELHAGRAGETAALAAIVQFEARFEAVAIETGAWRAVAFELGVGVVGDLGRPVEAGEGTEAEPHVAAQFAAGLLQLDMAARLARRFGRQAVGGAVVLHAQPGEFPGLHERNACGKRFHRGPRVLGEAERRFVVAGIAAGPVEIDRHVAETERETERTLSALVGRGPGGESARPDSVLRQLRRDGFVDHVDDAADRIAAIGERRRAAQDLDAAGIDRIGPDRVIGAGRGRIDRADAVFEHPDAIVTQAADDRAARARAVKGGGDARQAREKLAQRGVEAGDDGVAAQHRRALEAFDACAFERRGDDHLLAARWRRRGGEGERRGSGEQQSGEAGAHRGDLRGDEWPLYGMLYRNTTGLSLPARGHGRRLNPALSWPASLGRPAAWHRHDPRRAPRRTL